MSGNDAGSSRVNSTTVTQDKELQCLKTSYSNISASENTRQVNGNINNTIQFIVGRSEDGSVNGLSGETVKAEKSSSDPNIVASVLKTFLPTTRYDRDTIGGSGKPQRRPPWPIPRERQVSKFIGRHDVLSQISNFFAPIHSGAQQCPITLALVGMGGIGKTQIVMQYCWQAFFVDKAFPSVFWVNVHTKQSAENSLLKIANDLGISSDSMSTDQQVNAVLQTWSEETSPFLVVYDNLDDPDFRDMELFMPTYGPAAIIITSRLRNAADRVQHTIDVWPMAEDEAVDLLVCRSKLLRPVAGSLEEEDAKEIARTLDYLPLALDQAGAYIGSHVRTGGSGGGLRFFLDRFEERKREILKYVPRSWKYMQSGQEHQQSRYLNVVTTWELSLKLLGSSKDDRKDKVRFLTLAAFLGGHRVSKVLFKTYLRDPDLTSSRIDAHSALKTWTKLFKSNQGFDDHKFLDTIVELNELSLIRGFTEQGIEDLHFSMHSMVQEWAKLRFGSEDMEETYVPVTGEEQLYSQEAMDIMESVLKKFEMKNGRAFDISRLVDFTLTSNTDRSSFEVRCGEMTQELAEHIHACIKQAGEIGPRFDGSLSIEPQFAVFLKTLDARAAHAIWARILQREIDLHGVSQKRTMETMKFVLRKGASIGLIAEEALAIAQALENDQDSNQLDLLLLYSELMFNLVPMLHSRTNYVQADGQEMLSALWTKIQPRLELVDFDCCDQSLDIVLKISYGLIAIKELEAAQLLLVRVYSVLAAAEQDASTSPTFQLFHVVYIQYLRAAGEHEELHKIVRQCIQEAGLQQDSDPELIIPLLHVLVDSFADQRLWKEAATESLALVEYCNRRLGPLDQMTQITQIQSAVLCIHNNQGELDGSKKKIQNIVEGQRKVQGIRCWKTVHIEMKAASAYQNVGQPRLAYDMYRECYLTHSQWLHPNDSLRLDLEYACAMALTKVPDRTDQETSGMTQMFLDRRASLEDIQAQKTSDKQLANFWFEVGNYKQILRLEHLQTRIRNRDTWGYTNYDTGQAESVMIASCYRMLGDWAEARKWYGAILNDQIADGRLLNHDASVNLTHYAHACDKTNHREEAEHSYLTIIEYRILTYGQYDEMTIAAMNWLALSYKLDGNYGAAERQFRDILEVKLQAYGRDQKRVIDTRIQLCDTSLCMKTSAGRKDAITQLEPILQLMTQNEDPNDEDMANHKAELIAILCNLQRYSQALLFLRDLHDWQERLEKTYGSDSEIAIDWLFQLGICHSQAHRLQDAIRICLCVVERRKRISGVGHEKTIRAVYEVGNFYRILNQPTEALPFLIEAAEGYMAFEPKPAETWPWLNQLAETAGHARRWDLVEKYRMMTVTYLAESSPPVAMSELLFMKYLAALAQLQQGRVAAAESDIERCMEHCRLLDRASSDSALSSFWHAECQSMLGRPETAAEHYALFVSYQDGLSMDLNQTFITCYRKFTELQQRAWEQLALFD